MLLNYLKPLAIFAAVVESGSFTAAGNKLGLPRGKVSEQIGRLEDYLDVRLFIRNTRSLKITTEGEALYPHARQILLHGIEGVDEIKAFNENVEGKIRITTTSDFYECLLLPILKQFSAQYPDVRFDMQITETPLPVVDESIDIAIRSGDIEDSNLVAIPLIHTALKLYASTQFHAPTPKKPADLSGLKWVGLDSSDQAAALTLTHTSGNTQTIQPNYQHVASSISSYQQLIEQGFGIGIIAESSAELLVNQGRLISILPDWVASTMKVSLIYPHRIHMAKRTRLLIDMIKAELAL